MCRLIGYLGAERDLESLLYAPEFGLERQSWQPRRQIWGTINADGWGAGWYDPARPEPARYRTTQPMWSDRNFRNLAGVLRSTVVLGSVRSATPGSPTEETGTAPYCWGRWLFAHNGRVLGWKEGVSVALRHELDDEWLAVIEGAADSEVLFALVLQQIESRGAGPEEALARVSRLVRSHRDGRLNFLLTDGHGLWGSRWGEELLFSRTEGDGIVLASEPYDDGEGWRALPDESVTTVAKGRIATVAMSELT